MLDAELKSKINLLWNKFWSGGISNPLFSNKRLVFYASRGASDIFEPLDDFCSQYQH